MYNLHVPKPDGKMLLYSDSESDEEMKKGTDSRDGQGSEQCQERTGQESRDGGEEDEDDEDNDEAGSDAEDSGGITILKLHSIHSGMTQSTLKSYLHEEKCTKGLMEVKMLCVEKGTHPQTQTTFLQYDTATAAQVARDILSRCHLGPGGSQIKLEFVDLREIQQPFDEGQQSTIKESTDYRKRRTRRPTQRHHATTQQKTQTSCGGSERQSLVTVEVKNISIKREEFEGILTKLKVTSFQCLQWKPHPQGNRAFLLFEQPEGATSAQQILNNCSVGAANKKLVAVLQDRQNLNVGQMGQRRCQYSKIAQAGAEALPTRGLTGNVTIPEAHDRYDSMRCMRGGHTRVNSRIEGQQRGHHQSPGGACYIPPGYGLAHREQTREDESDKLSECSEVESIASMKSSARSTRGGKQLGGRPPQHTHPRGNRGRGRRDWPRSNQLIREDESDKLSECSEAVSIASMKSSASSTRGIKHLGKTSSLHITNIGESIDEKEFCDFLESLDLVCECLDFRNAKTTNTQFAVIQFPDCKKAADAKKVLDNDNWILGDSASHIKASFTIPRQPRGSSIGMHLLEHQDVDSRSNVHKWLEGNEDSTENYQRDYDHVGKWQDRYDSNRRRGSQGQVVCGIYTYHGRDPRECKFSGQHQHDQRFAPPADFNYLEASQSLTNYGRGGRHDFAGRGRNGRGRRFRGNVYSQRGRGYLGGQGQVGQYYAESGSSSSGHKREPNPKMKERDTEENNTLADGSRNSSGGRKGQPQREKQNQSAVPLDLDVLPLMTLAVKKPADHKPHPLLTGHNLAPNSKEVVVTDLPRDITELDIVDIVKNEECEGFIDARLSKDTDSRARTSNCLLQFRERMHAMDAVLKLYGKSVNGHRIQVHLSINHEQMEPAIAQKALAAFQDKEMPDKVKKIQSAIEDTIEKINLEEKELKESLKENLTFAELERCESSIAALEHQMDEQNRYLSEFNIACHTIKAAIHKLLVKGVSALSEVQKIRHHFERECRRAESPLPVFGYRSEIQTTIRENQALVLQGETGSGKSTQIPQYVVDMEREDRRDDSMSKGSQKWRVVCTQPRRVAALTLAKRVAEEYGCRVGEEIGYFVGNKKYVNSNTVVTFMTDRKLLNMCIADPNLSEYTCVIVDEAHERSVDTDILLATLKKLLKKRSDLHLLIMSATIDIKLFTDYLDGCEQLSVPGRTFPVDKYWCGDAVGIGEGDYVGKAIQQAAKVHKYEGAGDILVFLTSANEIETACRVLATTLGQRPNDQDNAVLILPLHGRLQPEDQMKVFAETRQGQRKIVFATNVAETSITIKGIKYVIDPGVVKECQYDPKRSMSLLKVTTITRASAEQRAGRAGRTSPGVCYRLYTKEEYSELEESMKPEILRVHLGMAALQLLELGIEDVENFDFIQAPDREATKQAMTSLRLLGAVDAKARLTPLGRKMATLPLEPRLSKLVLEGANRGLVMEAVVLAALISAPGSIFYRGGSDKDKEKADRLKLKFCHESGDTITMLNAYEQWNNQPEKTQKAWCMENSMNSKTLRATKETVKEVCQVLKQEHSIDCNHNDKMEAPDKGKSEMLQKVIMSGYFQTLSLYNGHQRAGYTVIAQQKSAHIHPSAALKALGSNPKWVVYEEFKRTSRDFLFNVTLVDVSWLEEVAPVFYNEIDLEALQMMAVEELPPIPLGTALMRRLSARRNEKLRALEEKVTAEQDSLCVIEINRDMKQLHMFVNRRCSSFATSFVQGFLDDERKMIEQQQIEVPVGESGVVRQVVIAGGETRFILMAKDYRALEISNMPADATEGDVERIIRFAGCSKEEILDVYRFPKHSTMAKSSKWGRVTFISPESAESAKEWLDVAVIAEETSLTVRALQGRGFQKRDIRRVNSRVVITWFTWPSKGHAYINCASTEDAMALCSAIDFLEFKGSCLHCIIKRNDTRALFIKNVDKHATQEELEAAIKRETSTPFSRCSIPREPPTSTIPTPVEVTENIYSMFDAAVEQNEINIDILPARSEKTQMRKAIVTFSGDSDVQVDACVAHIQNNPRYNSAGQMYHVKFTASCMLFCRPEVYRCLEEEIKCLVETARSDSEDLNIRVNKSNKTSDWMISISGENIQEVQIVRRLLLAYIQGETVPLIDILPDDVSDQKKTRVLDILHNGIRVLLNELNAHATVDTRRQVVVIFGKDSVRERFKVRLRDYIGIICNNMLRDILLTAGLSTHCTKGIAIRTLVRAYGPWLKKLQGESGATQITLNTRQGVVMIEGDQRTFDKVHDMVKNCLKEAGLEDAISLEAVRTTEEVECGICFTSVEGNDEVYRLSACSHGFHQDCLKEMFAVRLKEASKDYPIVCPHDGCHGAVLLCDIRILCPDETKRLRLFQWALEAHVIRKSNGKLKFCPTADCHMIYKLTDDAQTFVCPECRGRLCSSCGAEPHSGQTCDELKNDKQFDIEHWLKTEGHGVKKCPSPQCGLLMEKRDGCNHMICRQCKKHICWVCLEYFNTQGECYGHLTAKHGGCF